MSSISAIRVAARVQPAKQAVIFLHGLGDTGSGWSFFADFLQRDALFKHTNFVFPNAPVLSITANGNYPMPAWFDIREWEEVQSRPDVDGFLKSLETVRRLIDEQVENGIAAENIVVGGFSQGASLALASAVSLPVKIGGFVAFSGFSMINNKLLENKQSINKDTPVFHGHGSVDPVISLDMGQTAQKFYTGPGGLTNYTMKVYPGMPHSTCQQEIDDVVSFLHASLKLEK